MDEKKILIIIPTYNEGLIIEKVISEINTIFKKVDILVIDAYSSDEIIFTKGCTEGFNFLANSICKELSPGDEIILSEIQHHANIIPWQMAAEKYSLKINYINMKIIFGLDFAKKEDFG